MIESDGVIKVKEYLVEFNEEKGMITRFAAIIERAAGSLLDIVKKQWSDPAQENGFTFIEFYYMWQSAIEAIGNLNLEQNVYYGDMKPANLLITRDRNVKIGDFGVSI